MAQAKRGAHCAPVTSYGRRARYALVIETSMEHGPGMERFEDLASMARAITSLARFPWGQPVCEPLQWFRGQWVPL